MVQQISLSKCIATQVASCMILPKFYAIDTFTLTSVQLYLIIFIISCFRVTTSLRDYTKIEEQRCQLVTDYGGKKFNKLRSVAVGPNDEVVMIDRGNKEVIIFDKDLKLIRTFGQGSGDSKLNDPADIAVGHNIIVVSEWDDHVVKKFSLQGDYLSKFGSHGRGDSQFNHPLGLCFNSKGLLYVVDHSNYRVQVFRENVFLFKFGSKGPNPGQFRNHHYIAVDSSDQVYVTDYDANGISVFSEDGHFIRKINCNNPFIICISPDDYVISDADDVLTVFSPTHKLIAKFGVYGNAKGQFSDVEGIAINGSGTIFVTESNSERLQIITT